jgi:hypothetical protein
MKAIGIYQGADIESQTFTTETRPVPTAQGTDVLVKVRPYR